MVFAKLAEEISCSFTARTLSVCNGSRRELWTGQCGRQANANPNSNPERWRRAAYRLALDPLDRVPLSRPSDGLDEQLHPHGGCIRTAATGSELCYLAHHARVAEGGMQTLADGLPGLIVKGSQRLLAAPQGLRRQLPLAVGVFWDGQRVIIRRPYLETAASAARKAAISGAEGAARRRHIRSRAEQGCKHTDGCYYF